VAWQKIRAKCLNVNNAEYAKCGGVGVKICIRWADSFENFIEDMGIAPSPKHSLGRYPNKKGNYEPNNCQWWIREKKNR
jgi:hypothetical protein